MTSCALSNFSKSELIIRINDLECELNNCKEQYDREIKEHKNDLDCLKQRITDLEFQLEKEKNNHKQELIDFQHQMKNNETKIKNEFEFQMETREEKIKTEFEQKMENREHKINKDFKNKIDDLNFQLDKEKSDRKEKNILKTQSNNILLALSELFNKENIKIEKQILYEINIGTFTKENVKYVNNLKKIMKAYIDNNNYDEKELLPDKIVQLRTIILPNFEKLHINFELYKFLYEMDFKRNKVCHKSYKEMKKIILETYALPNSKRSKLGIEDFDKYKKDIIVLIGEN
jgi:hypothetical protein